jgi:putative Holliday junction resolvase
MKVIALDVGEKKIGIAISDALRITAQPRETLFRKNKKADLERIKDIVHEEGATKIVIGLPLNMNGTAGARAEAVYNFVEELKKELKVSVQVWDERLSTLQANRILLEADMSRRKRKKLDDRIAAQLILQSYLDSRDKKL